MNLPKYHKKKMIYSWKQSGVIYDNMDTLYQYYINCKYCEWCYKVFENTRDRCLDHDHSTGEFRLIVCQKCNCHDSYLKYPDGYDRKEYDKKYKEKNRDKLKEYSKKYEKNKDKIKEYNKEYYEKNIDKIKAKNKAKNKEKYDCECGMTLTKCNKARHFKTFKHLSNTL